MLDPLGLRLVTQGVLGNSNDPLYGPAIRQAQASLAERVITYVAEPGSLSSGGVYSTPGTGLEQAPAATFDYRVRPR